LKTGRDERAPFDWPALALLTWLYLIVAWGVAATEWTQGLDLLPAVAAGAVILGTMLAVSRWPGTLAHSYSLITGSLYVALISCILFPPELAWRDRLINLGYRLNGWLYRAISGEPGGDSLVFVIIMALTLWWASHLAAWATFRWGNVWWATVPGGLITILNIYYGPPHLGPYMLLYLFTAFLLILRMNFRFQEREWLHSKIGYNPYIGFDFFRYGILFIIFLLAVAWLAPSVEAQPDVSDFFSSFREPWHRVQKEWNRLFSSLKGYRSGGYGPVVFGKQMTLGGPVRFGEAVVMDVEVKPAFMGRYWRGAVYDFYTGRGWVNTDELLIPLGVGDNPPVPSFEARQPLTQTYQIFEPEGNLLFAAYQPVRLLIPGWAYVAQFPLSGEEKAVEISLLYSRSTLKRGQRYRVVSLVSRATEEALRQAGQDYPDWVVPRYLQLPPGLPERVRKLAEEITAPYDNPYDKASALERYLRDNIAYNENIPPPPEGRDAVDYFLFDLREGYCNYYASAMVVMARAVGIPARLAAGYARGDYDPATGRFRVREKNAHSWVEVFFPRYGWVEFEPTSVEPPIFRPRAETTSREPGSRPTRIPEDEEAFGPSEIPTPEATPPSRPWEFLTLKRPPAWLRNVFWATLLICLIGWLLWRHWEPRSLSPAARAYLRLQRLASLAGLPPRFHQTPYEYAAALTGAFPRRARAINTIVSLYVRERFGGYAPDEEALRRLGEAWRTLLPTLALALMTRWRKKQRS